MLFVRLRYLMSVEGTWKQLPSTSTSECSQSTAAESKLRETCEVQTVSEMQKKRHDKDKMTPKLVQSALTAASLTRSHTPAPT